MNLCELKRELDRLSIPKDAYSLRGGLPNESYCIGKKDGKWEVYYSERGRKSALQIFSGEHDACIHFLSMISRQKF